MLARFQGTPVCPGRWGQSRGIGCALLHRVSAFEKWVGRVMVARAKVRRRSPVEKGSGIGELKGD